MDKLICSECKTDLSRIVPFKHSDGFGFCSNTYRCPNCKKEIVVRYNYDNDNIKIYTDYNYAELYTKLSEKKNEEQ